MAIVRIDAIDWFDDELTETGYRLKSSREKILSAIPDQTGADLYAARDALGTYTFLLLNEFALLNVGGVVAYSLNAVILGQP